VSLGTTVPAWRSVPKQFRKLSTEPLQLLRLLRLTFPRDDASLAQFPQRALMKVVAGGVAFQLRDPPDAAVRGRRAVFAAAMSMPKATVNEDGGSVFRKKNVQPGEPTPDPSQEWSCCSPHGRIGCFRRGGGAVFSAIVKMHFVFLELLDMKRSIQP